MRFLCVQAIFCLIFALHIKKAKNECLSDILCVCLLATAAVYISCLFVCSCKCFVIQFSFPHKRRNKMHKNNKWINWVYYLENILFTLIRCFFVCFIHFVVVVAVFWKCCVFRNATNKTKSVISLLFTRCCKTKSTLRHTEQFLKCFSCFRSRKVKVRIWINSTTIIR